MTSGKITYCAHPPTTPNSELTWAQRLPIPRWRIDLASLSVRGSTHIAHDASLVHPNYVESHSPDKPLLHKLLTLASRNCTQSGGLSLTDIALYHHEREQELHSPPNNFHKGVALGECGLGWAVMRRRLPTEQLGDASDEHEEVIPEHVLKTWFGAERLPGDWWAEGGSRPVEPVGLVEARHRANDVAKIIAKQH